MPAKLYLQSPPYGDFRAMPALGDGMAMLKWIASFPGNPVAHGLPTVTASWRSATPRRACRGRCSTRVAVTALRTGAVAAVAARALAPPQARTVGHRSAAACSARWAARCLAADGYGPGVCCDPRPEAADELAAELGWEAGDLRAALACDVVCSVTPGTQPVVDPADLRLGLHLNMLGADGPGKAEATPRRDRRLRAVLRRVGAGLARRRAHRRGRGGPRRPASRSPTLGAVLAGDGARPLGARTRSRCSTRRASRSRTSRSRSPARPRSTAAR